MVTMHPTWPLHEMRLLDLELMSTYQMLFTTSSRASTDSRAILVPTLIASTRPLDGSITGNHRSILLAYVFTE